MKQWIWWKNIWQRGCHAASTWPAKVEGSSLLHRGIQLPRDHFSIVLSFHCEKGSPELLPWNKRSSQEIFGFSERLACKWTIFDWLFHVNIFASTSTTGADGLQLSPSHIVQEEGGGAPGASPAFCQNSNRVGGLQRQQSAIQGIPLRTMVVSNNITNGPW